MLISDLNDLTEAVKWCDVCRGHVDGECDGCHIKFLHNEHWYRSQTYHYHPATVEGVAGTRAVQKALCVECYRADHAKAYPDLQVPDLPDRGVDPRFHAAQKMELNRERVKKLLESLTAAPEDMDLLRRVAETGLRFM